MRLIARPIDTWPEALTPEDDREVARFTALWSDTVEVLAREVEMLATGRDPEVVLQIAVTERDIRNDGWIRADARPQHPGVIVSFESKHGPLRYSTDRFRNHQVWRSGRGYVTVPGWQANVRAIALGLEALRKVDRYGIARGGEQYRGWNALPAGRPMGAPMTVEEAAAFIAEHSDEPEGRAVDVADDPSFALVLFKQAARRLHPDHGGDAALFRRLTEARQLLEASCG